MRLITNLGVPFPSTHPSKSYEKEAIAKQTREKIMAPSFLFLRYV